MTSTNLLPCPFCGRDAELIHIYHGVEVARCVNEDDCFQPTITRPTAAKAIADWNRRAPGQCLHQISEPAAVAGPADDGWLQVGGLLYRLTDERRPCNRDEINVTMADGSRSDEARARRAGELLGLIRDHAALAATPEVPATKESSAGDLAEPTKLGLWEELNQRHLDLLQDVLDAKEVMAAAGIEQNDFASMFKSFAARAEVQAEPVAGQSRWKGEQEWGLCTAEHVRMALSDPRYAADGYEVRYLYTAPQATQPLTDLPDLPHPEHDKGIGWTTSELLAIHAYARAYAAVNQMQATQPQAPAAPVTEQSAGDSICAWSVWWTHSKSKFTTPRQAALAAWNYANERVLLSLAAPAAPAAPAVDALDATDRECLAIGRAVNRAALELPADGDIRIHIENGSGAVYVYEPKRENFRYIDSGDVFSAQINAAIDAAIQAAKGAE